MTRAVALPLDERELTISDGATRIRRSVLASGIRVLTEEMPGAGSASVGFWVPSGSRDETPAALGSTHFLEHLLFKGTPTRTALDIAVEFDSVGGEHNAATAKEHTSYYAKVGARSLPMAVDVLADMVAASLLDAEDFETERGVILEELAAAEDDPGDVVGERFFEAVLGEHPLGRPIGGNPGTIRAATRDAVAAHYRASYRPERLVVTAAGAVDHDALVGLAVNALRLAGWDVDAEASAAPRRPGEAAPITRGAAATVIRRPTEQTHLLVGVPALTVGDPRRTTLAVLNSVLGGGMSSRLFQEIRERRGLAYSVYSFAASYSDAGVLGLSAATAHANVPAVAELMLAELAALARRPLTALELQRAVGQLAGAAALALEDSEVRMSRLARSEIGTGEFVGLDEQIRRLEAVTVDDVLELATDLLGRPLSATAVGTADAGILEGLAASVVAAAV